MERGIHMSLSEISYLLADAGKTLEFLIKSHESSLDTVEVSIALRMKIKHFLEDVKSSLDYIGFDIFTKYCLGEIKARYENPVRSNRKTISNFNEFLEDHLKRLYFPNIREEKEFVSYINDKYPKLEQSHPEIVYIFRSVQRFTKTQWYIDLNELVNKNKHRRLTKQEQKVNERHIHHMETLDGSIFSNIIGANGSGNIIINGKPFDPPNGASNSPLVKSFVATYYTHIIFTDLDKPVIPTLTKIYDGVTLLFSRLERFL